MAKWFSTHQSNLYNIQMKCILPVKVYSENGTDLNITLFSIYQVRRNQGTNSLLQRWSPGSAVNAAVTRPTWLQRVPWQWAEAMVWPKEHGIPTTLAAPGGLLWIKHVCIIIVTSPQIAHCCSSYCRKNKTEGRTTPELVQGHREQAESQTGNLYLLPLPKLTASSQREVSTHTRGNIPKHSQSLHTSESSPPKSSDRLRPRLA